MSNCIIDREKLKICAKNAEPENKTFFNWLKKKKPKQLDTLVHRLHREVFEEIDCLNCANCCKGISPMIFMKDIERISKCLRIKTANFMDQYINLDEDNHYVFKQTPCPFLLGDNFCEVYEQRPRSCREYPHTDRKRFYQILSLTIKNTYHCPAVFEIVERLKTYRNKL